MQPVKNGRIVLVLGCCNMIHDTPTLARPYTNRPINGREILHNLPNSSRRMYIDFIWELATVDFPHKILPNPPYYSHNITKMFSLILRGNCRVMPKISSSGDKNCGCSSQNPPKSSQNSPKIFQNIFVNFIFPTAR